MRYPNLKYRVDASHVGADDVLDAKIERRAGRPPLGTGFSCTDRRRDLGFGFVNKSAALRAAARIRTLRGVRAAVRRLETA